MSGHVLLIGDDGPARNALRDRLHHALFNVTPCDRLGSIDADQYDCVLDTRGRIPPKSQFAHAALPILAICDANRDHGDILGQGAEDVIAAPFHDRELIARIRAMIRRRHASRELKLREGTNRALGFNESPDVFAHQKNLFCCDAHRRFTARIGKAGYSMPAVSVSGNRATRFPNHACGSQNRCRPV